MLKKVTKKKVSKKVTKEVISLNISEIGVKRLDRYSKKKFMNRSQVADSLFRNLKN